MAPPEKDMSFFGLNRPEYIPAPEIFMAELAWKLVGEKVRKEILDNGRFFGIAYGPRSAKRKEDIRLTKIVEQTDEFTRYSRDIKNILCLSQEKDADIVAKTLSEEIEIHSSGKMVRTVALPLTFEAAMLQDRYGVTGKRAPANVARILEQVYALGGGEKSAAQVWASAIKRASGQGLPTWVERGIASISSGSYGRSSTSGGYSNRTKQDFRQPKWLTKENRTPFFWFAQSWQRLCSDRWINAMPRRRWTDWLTCIARTGIATAYLFEMHTVYRLVSSLASDREPGDVLESLRSERSRIFIWDERKTRAERNVSPVINKLVSLGTACQKFLQDMEDVFPQPLKYDNSPEGLSEWFVAARKEVDSRPVLKHKIAEALDSENVTSASARNVGEVIRYSLRGRGGSQMLDLYGMLRFVRPYTWVEPGQEWLVALASLCSPQREVPARLADLNVSLSALGISVSSSTLISRLETYGLIRSSHDADDAIEIQSAFY